MKKSRVLDLFFGFLLVPAGLSLIIGLYTGVIRLGSNLPSVLEVGAMAHGPVMINGFLATLISLERSAAIEKYWSFLAPLSFALSTFFLLAGVTYAGGFFLMCGSVILLITMLYLCALQLAVHHIIIAAGALSLLVGNIFFVNGFPVYEFTGWWLAFPLLTIFGERIELNRINKPPAQAVRLFTLLISFWIAALVIVHFERDIGWQLVSLLMVILALWFLKFDVARKTIRSGEWTRYSAWCLLTGYGWMFVAGIAGIFYGLPNAGFIYDALLHMIYVGFVFSMIFAHASVILPALTGKIVPWHTYFYLPLILLHASLFMRVSGDLLFISALRTSGSYGSIVAILLFIGGIVIQIARRKSNRIILPA